MPIDGIIQGFWSLTEPGIYAYLAAAADRERLLIALLR
jgi:hypothetical protein